MADWYIWSGATGAGTGADWANAFVNLTSISTKAAGDNFYVAHDHAQTAAAITTITSPGTDASPCRIMCVDRAGTVPPVEADLRTTATVTTTGNFSITLAGSVSDCYGITFTCADGTANAAASYNNTAGRACKFRSCTFRTASTGTGAIQRFNSGGTSNFTILDNCSFEFKHIGQYMFHMGGRIHWRNSPTAIIGATFPTNLFRWGAAGRWIMEGVNLSGFISKTLCDSSVSTQDSWLLFKDCSIGGSTIPMIAPTSQSWGGVEAYVVRTGTLDVQYTNSKISYAGQVRAEISPRRNGGASDGVQPIGWTIVTTANVEFDLPFECLPITVWNDTIGTPKTLTIEGIWGTAGTPTNADIWIDVYYLGTSGTSLATKATTMKTAFISANTSYPAGSGTWTGSTNKFAMSVTFTPQEKGFITVYVMAAKVSTTFYIDPKPVLT